MKKIEDYDIGNAFTRDSLNRESLLDIIKPCPMWVIDGQRIVTNAMDQWLKKDNSEISRERLFCEMLRRSYFAQDQSVKSALFYNSFNAIEEFKDKHCAIAWKILYNSIPVNGAYTYTWHIISCKSSHNIPDLEYKEFKASIVDNAFKEGKYGVIRLLLLSDKSILKPRHLPMLLGSRTMLEELGDVVSTIKMPLVYSEKVEYILLKALNNLSSDIDNSVSRKGNNILLEFINTQINSYSDTINIGQKLLPVISNLAPEQLEIIKANGLIELLSYNKMNHELVAKDTKNKAFKL